MDTVVSDLLPERDVVILVDLHRAPDKPFMWVGARAERKRTLNGASGNGLSVRERARARAKERETETETDREAGRRAGRQAGRQTETQTETRTETETETETERQRQRGRETPERRKS